VSAGWVAEQKAKVARKEAAKVATRRRRKAALIQTVRSIAQRAKPVILATTGLVFFTAAAWTVSMTLGLVVAGLACWVLEWRLKP
jgi:hypothetical protein